MQRFLCVIRSVIILLLSLASHSSAQDGIYASVYASSDFIIGSKYSSIGLFFRGNADTAWALLSRPNLKGFHSITREESGTRRIFLAAGSGLLTSSDGGKHWRTTTDWRVTEVLSIAYDAANTSTIFISSAVGVFRSDDGAKTWQKKSEGLPASHVSKIIIDRANPSRLLCTSEEGIFVSMDRGEHWKKIISSFMRIRSIIQHPKSAEIFFAATEHDGMIVSTDAGKIWRVSSKDLKSKTLYVISIDSVDPNRMFAGGYGTGIYASTDGGSTWTQKTTGLGNLHIHAIAIDHRDRKIIYAGTMGDGVYRSDDGGETWKSYGLRGKQVWSIELEREK